MGIEINLGMKILGCLQVLSAINAISNLIDYTGFGGAWFLVWVPSLLGSCFSAWRFIQWFQNQADPNVRGNLIQGWNANIAGFVATYLLTIIVVLVCWDSLTAGTTTGTSTVKVDMSAVKTATITSLFISMLIGVAIFWYYRKVTIDHARDGGFKQA